WQTVREHHGGQFAVHLRPEKLTTEAQRHREISLCLCASVVINSPPMKTITRRDLLRSLPVFAIAPRILSQAPKPVIPVKALNYFALEVSDVKRSVEFYQGLFGMPIQLRRDGGVFLRIGNGPQFLAIMPAGSSAPRIVPSVGMTVENFNADRLVAALLQHGFA